MLDENSPFSLYYQLKGIIINNIKSGVWKMNSRIPTERELCKIYSISRITVRQALKELEDEGYLYRKQGKGTFVTAPKIVQKLSEFYSFSEEIAKMGAQPSTRIICFNVMEAEPSIAEKLKLTDHEKVFAIKRLRLADNEPFAIETSYIVCKYAAGLSEEAVNQHGLYNALNIQCGVIPDEAIETFEAVIINNEEAEYLGVGKKTSALHLERITSASGNLIELCVSTIRGDKYKYTVRLKANKSLFA